MSVSSRAICAAFVIAAITSSHAYAAETDDISIEKAGEKASESSAESPTPSSAPEISEPLNPPNDIQTNPVAASQDNMGQVDGEKTDDLLDLSLEELLAQEVTSVAKKSRRIADSAAAVTVITQEDIRRSSARTVPDLLRMVPGMEIAEVQSSATSVAARGFTSRFAANLLVMVDGAAIYSTSISGMFWDQALIPLQDIERIEVIRGPGGTLWGSNSINGIVNIITKQSVDTQGLRLNASVGTSDRRGEVGYGSRITDNLGFRVYGDYRHTKGLDGPHGDIPNNGWKGGLAGVRFDYAPSANDSIVALAEYSEGRFKERFVAVNFDPANPGTTIQIQHNKFHSFHTLLRWKHEVNDDFDFTVQGYYNNLMRTEFGATIDRDLYDLSAEGRWRVSPVHELNFGIAGRISKDKIGSNFSLTLPSKSNTDRWLTGYIQDDITIIPDKLRFTLGSKFEENNFTGTEIQPSARLFFRANPEFAAWASVSRAVRTPLLIQREMVANVTLMRNLPGFPAPVPVNASFYGSPDAKAEQVISYELGFRGGLGNGWSYDVAAHYSDYNDLVSANLISQTPIFIPPIPFPVGVQLDNVIGNSGSGKSKGIEILLSGAVTNWWDTKLSYSYLDLDVKSDPGTYLLAGTGTSAKHQARFISYMNLTDNFSLDSTLHYVGRTQNKERKAYTDLDVRATYRINSQIDLSVVGSNLLHKRRLEYYHDSLPLELVYVPRTAYIEARVRF